jgi:sphingomyelin phosphodiesterase acid-like 3
MQLREIYPNVRIYPTLGNNDSDCGDYAVAPNSVFLANFRDIWRGPVASRSFERRFPTGGYYHADIPALKNVRLIALNTNFFSTNYKNPCGQLGPDPATRQLQWFEAELALARNAGKRVWLLFHIPPGMDVYDTEEYGGTCPNITAETFWKDEYQQQYLQITAKYRNTILGSFAGHTHQDEFRLVNGDFVHISPSISPIFGNNPAFEIVDVNRDGKIADYTTWHLSNATLPWAREYAFDDAYKKSKYDASSLTEIAASIGTDTATRERYFQYMSSGSAKSSAEALAKWEGYWCGLKAITGNAFSQCYCGTR